MYDHHAKIKLLLDWPLFEAFLKHTCSAMIFISVVVENQSERLTKITCISDADTFCL